MFAARVVTIGENIDQPPVDVEYLEADMPGLREEEIDAGRRVERVGAVLPQRERHVRDRDSIGLEEDLPLIVLETFDPVPV